MDAMSKKSALCKEVKERWPNPQVVLAGRRIALCGRQAVSKVGSEELALLALLLLILLEVAVR